MSSIYTSIGGTSGMIFYSKGSSRSHPVGRDLLLRLMKPFQSSQQVPFCCST